MPDLLGTQTYENLKAAFARECQDQLRYLYFAKVAEIEGETAIAKLFRDTAEGETGHAQGHLDFLKEVGDPTTQQPIGDTLSNLEAAITGENYDATQFYPDLARTARAEGFAQVASWFETLAKAEESHARRMQQGLDSLE